MPTTYEPIATNTLATGSLAITFSSIPATYTDLRLVLVAKVNIAAGNIWLTFNGDTATNYSAFYINSGGASANSGRFTSVANIALAGAGAGTSTSVDQLFTTDVFSYAGSTFKTVLSTDNQDINGENGNVTARVGLWRNTAAITSVSLSATTGRLFAIGTTATLYGIKNA